MAEEPKETIPAENLTQDQILADPVKVKLLVDYLASDRLVKRLNSFLPEKKKELGLNLADGADNSQKIREIAEHLVKTNNITIYKADGTTEEKTFNDLLTDAGLGGRIAEFALQDDWRKQFYLEATRVESGESTAKGRDAEAEAKKSIRAKVAEEIEKNLGSIDANTKNILSGLGLLNQDGSVKYQDIADQLINNRALGANKELPIADIQDMVNQARSKKEPPEPPIDLNALIPDNEKIDKAAKAIGDAVSANTSDTTPAMAKGASWMNLLFGLFQWFSEGFQGGFNRLKEIIATDTANGIETDVRKNLTNAGGFSPEEINKYADSAKNAALSSVGFTPPKPEEQPAQSQQGQSTGTTTEAPQDNGQLQGQAGAAGAGAGAAAGAAAVGGVSSNGTTQNNGQQADQTGATTTEPATKTEVVSAPTIETTSPPIVKNAPQYTGKSSKEIVDGVTAQVMKGAESKTRSLISQRIHETVTAKENQNLLSNPEALAQKITDDLLSDPKTHNVVFNGVVAKVKNDAQVAKSKRSNFNPVPSSDERKLNLLYIGLTGAEKTNSNKDDVIRGGLSETIQNTLVENDNVKNLQNAVLAENSQPQQSAQTEAPKKTPAKSPMELAKENAKEVTQNKYDCVPGNLTFCHPTYIAGMSKSFVRS